MTYTLLFTRHDKSERMEFPDLEEALDHAVDIMDREFGCPYQIVDATGGVLYDQEQLMDYVEQERAVDLESATAGDEPL